jgi:hypothetical protein
MTYLLLRAIKKFLEDAFEKTVFRDPDSAAEKHVAPRVFIGALPPKRQNGEEQGKDFPYIVVRPKGGDDNEDNGTATVLLLLGIFTKEGEEGGTNDMQNLIDRIRRYLLQEQIIDGCYKLEFPLSWDVGEGDNAQQPDPYYIGAVTTTWRMPGVERVLSPEEQIEAYGAGLYSI